MALWIIAAFVSAFVKGLCGAGDAPVFSSIMAFAHDNIEISPVSLLLSFPSNVYVAWKNRKGLKTKIWLPLSLLLIAGTIPGTLLLKNLDTRVIKTYFGFFIIFVGVLMLINELGHKKWKASKLLLILIGILTGLSNGVFGIGILLVVYMTQTTDNLEEFKANVCAVFALENTVRMVLYIILGIINRGVLIRTISIFPFVLAGLLLGAKSAEHIDERKVMIVIMTTLILSGILIVLTNL